MSETTPVPVRELAVCAEHLSVHGLGGWFDALDPAVVLDAVGGL